MILCDYCEKPAEFVDSARVYRGTSYGMIWDCRACDAYVGVHKGTDQPLGRLANKELRIWKMKAHKVFDRLWKDGNMHRHDAYAWLAKAMGLTRIETHIGMFDEAQCERVCQLVGQRNPAKQKPARVSKRIDFSLPICAGAGRCPPPWEDCNRCVAQVVL